MATILRRLQWPGRKWKPLAFSNTNFGRILLEENLEQELIPGYVASRYYPCAHWRSPQGSLPDRWQAGVWGDFNSLAGAGFEVQGFPFFSFLFFFFFRQQIFSLPLSTNRCQSTSPCHVETLHPLQESRPPSRSRTLHVPQNLHSNEMASWPLKCPGAPRLL